MGPEAFVPIAMHDTGTDGDELEKMCIPFETLDGQLDADNSVRPHGCSLGTHARQGQLPGVIHRLRQHIQLLVFAPTPVLDAYVINAGPDTEANRLEARFTDQEKLIDAEIRREDSRGVDGA